MHSPKPHWYSLTPDKFLAGLLAVEVLLFLADRYAWFGLASESGWNVLLAVAHVGATLLIGLLWCGASLLFRWQFQFSIRSLCLLMTSVALVCSWFAVKMQQANTQTEIVEEIRAKHGEVDYDYQFGPRGRIILGSKSPAPAWLLTMLGEDFFSKVGGVYFREFGEGIPFDKSFDDEDLFRLQEFSNLRHLGLARTQVTDAGLVHIRQMKNLSVLNLRITGVTDAGLKHIQNLSLLEVLELDSTKVTDAGLEHLEGLGRLEVLTLYDTQVTDAGLKHLQSLHHLEWLYLYNTQVTDAGLKHLQGLKNLRGLGLDNTCISDVGLQHLVGTNLHFLELRGTKVSDEGLKHLKRLANLVELTLYDTKVTEHGVAELQQALPNCIMGH